MRRAVARHHALRGAVIPRVNRAHETLIEVDADRHVAAFARRRHRRLELRIQQLSRSVSGHLQSNGNGNEASEQHQLPHSRAHGRGISSARPPH